MNDQQKKSEITSFAKDCAYAHEKAVKFLCMSEQIAHNKIGTLVLDESGREVLVEVSKKFSKYVKEEMGFDLDNGDTQSCQDILNAIIDCCEENDWFRQ